MIKHGLTVAQPMKEPDHEIQRKMEILNIQWIIHTADGKI